MTTLYKVIIRISSLYSKTKYKIWSKLKDIGLYVITSN